MLLPLKDSNPLKVIPFQVVTVAIIALCTGVFALQAMLPQGAAEDVAMSFGMIPAVLFGYEQPPPQLAAIPPEATIFTAMFLHAGWLHLGGNMLYLWVFGDNIEDAMGHARFVVFYLVCGVVATLTYGLMNPASTMPLVGASGAISGVLGAYLLLHPRVRIITLIFYRLLLPLPLPAYIVLGGWILLQVLNALVGETVPAAAGTAWWAHIGGFVAGVLLIVPMRRKGVKLLDRGRY